MPVAAMARFNKINVLYKNAGFRSLGFRVTASCLHLTAREGRPLAIERLSGVVEREALVGGLHRSGLKIHDLKAPG
jgi:hypothetical protein